MEDTQLSLFGKTSSELIPAITERTSAPCWKSLHDASSRELLFLDLSKGNGQKPAALQEMAGASPGARLTLNTGESPSAAVESRLSWILEVNAPEKYYLSEKACQGILTRASRRGKDLPAILKQALLDMIDWWTEKDLFGLD